MVFAVPVDNRVKSKENEKRDKYLDLARKLTKQKTKKKQKTKTNKTNWNTNCDERPRYCHPRISKETGRLGNERTNGDYPALLRSPKILRRVRETLGHCNSNFSE